MKIDLTLDGKVVLGRFGPRIRVAQPLGPAPDADMGTSGDTDEVEWLEVAIEPHQDFTRYVVGVEGLGAAVIEASADMQRIVPLPSVTEATTRLVTWRGEAVDGDEITYGRQRYAQFLQMPPGEELPELELVTPPVAAGDRIGDQMQIELPVWNVPAEQIGVTVAIEKSPTGDPDGEDWTVETPTPSQVPPGFDSLYWRASVTGELGDVEITTRSNVVGPVVVSALSALTAENVVFDDSFELPSGRFKPVVNFTGISNPEDCEFRWSMSRPTNWPADPLPPQAWQSFEWDAGREGYITVMTDPEESDDYASFSLDGDERHRFRVSHRRWSGSAWSDWSPISEVMTIPLPPGETVDPTPTDGYDEYRQGLHRTDPSATGADGMQFMTAGAVAPDGIYRVVGQDSGGIRRDKGAGWHYPPNQGLPVFQCMGLWIDPVKLPSGKWRTWAVMSPGFELNSKPTGGGVWRSDDECETWTQVRIVDEARGGQVVSFGIAGWPLTGPHSSRYIFAAIGRRPINGSHEPTRFWRSAAGGSGGDEVALSPFSTYGAPYVVVPQSATLVWMGTTTGLWRSTNGGTTLGGWSRILNIGAVRSLWIDPEDPDHMICSVTTSNAGNAGVYETFNSWSTRTRILAERIHHIAVGAKPASGQRVIYASLSRGVPESRVMFVRRPNGTWVSGLTSPAVQRHPIGVQAAMQPFNMLAWAPEGSNASAMAHGWTIADPTDPLKATHHGKTGQWQTLDGGLNWYLDMRGWGGLNHRRPDSFNWDAQPDGDPDHYDGSLHDTGRFMTRDGWATSVVTSVGATIKNRITIVAGSANSWAFSCAAIMPDDSRVTNTAARGRFFGGYGHNNGLTALLYMDKGDTSFSDRLGGSPSSGQSNANANGCARRMHAGYLDHTPDKCWCGTNYSSDGQATWGNTNRQIWAEAYDGTDAVYGYDQSTGAIYRSANVFSGGGFGSVWYQPNPGGGWRNNGVAVGAVSPHDGRVFIRGQGSTSIVMLTHNGSTADATTFSIAHLRQASTDKLTSIAVDPLDGRYLLLGWGSIGTTLNIVRARFNWAFTAIVEWESLTTNDPCGAHTIDVAVNPWTGVAWGFYSGMGAYSRRSPADWQPRMGVIAFSGQPANGNTLTINGQTLTFVTGTPTGLQSQIGGNLAATLANLADTLNASAHAAIRPCTYTVRGADLDVRHDDPPRDGTETAFPLSAAGTPNASIRMQRRAFRDRDWLGLPLPVHSTQGAPL